jgi:hypothetical protein
MTDLLPFLVVVTLCVIGAWLTTGSVLQRALGIGVAFLSFGAPWLLPRSHLLVRSLLAIFLFVGVMRVTDLRSGEWGLGARLGHALSAVDSRRLTRTAPRLELGALGRLVAWECACGLAYVTVTRVAPLATGALYWALRWGGALAFVYTLSEGAYALLYAAHRAVGLTPPLLHKDPVAARSVQEFWGKRWNRTVSSWLGENFFRPLARRGRPALGVLAAFAVSGVVHAYITFVAIGAVMAAWMMGFFLLQGILVLVESVAGTTRWKATPSHVWTLTWMVAASPMFTEPLLRVLGV